MNFNSSKLLRLFIFNALAFFVLIMLFAPKRVLADSTNGCILQADGTYLTTDNPPKPCVAVDTHTIGFKIPTLSGILTFFVRMIFVVGGILALFFLIQGAFAWITSGGEKDAIGKAQAKIQAAILGVILIAVVLALAVTLEQVVFQKTVCFGLSCPLTIPSLLEKAP